MRIHDVKADRVGQREVLVRESEQHTRSRCLRWVEPRLSDPTSNAYSLLGQSDGDNQFGIETRG
jgi:hypothetical protein